MHIKSYLLMIVFVLLPFAPLGFVGNQAYAAKRCCNCGETCGSDCICNGTWPCFWCAAPNSGLEANQAAFPTDHSSAIANHNGIPAAVLSSAIERVLADIRRSHRRENLTQRLVETINYDLKFSCPYADDGYLQGERLGIQAKANTEN